MPAADKVAQTAHNWANHLKKQQSMRHINVELDSQEPHSDLGNDSFRILSTLEGGGQEALQDESQNKLDLESLTSEETEDPVDDDKKSQQKQKDGPPKKNIKKPRRKSLCFATSRLKDDWDLITEVLSPRRASMYIRNVLLFLICPATVVSWLLYYFADNPYTGYAGDGENDEEESTQNNKASISYWIIFICIRQVVTLTLALLTQAVVIDFLAVSSWIFLRFFGPVVTLFLAGSKGFPFVVTAWGIYDLALLSGSSRFAQHWAYAQTWIEMFNANNPAGTVTSSQLYLQIIQIAIALGIAISIKRLVVGLFLGRQTFAHYSQDLASVMNKMVLVGAVAGHARDIERNRKEFLLKSRNLANAWVLGWNSEDLRGMMSATLPESGSKIEESTKNDKSYQDAENSSKIMDLLDRWEEPDRKSQREVGASIGWTKTM